MPRLPFVLVNFSHADRRDARRRDRKTFWSAIPKVGLAIGLVWGATAQAQECAMVGSSECGLPRAFDGVDCSQCPCGKEPRWADWRPIPWEVFAQGEYVGPHRAPHVFEYRLRVDDAIQIVYRLTRRVSSHPYELNVGDRIRIESVTDETVQREVIIQPDGAITDHLLGQVQAAGLTIQELENVLEARYTKYLKVPTVTVTPIAINTRLEDLRNTVDARQGAGGQIFRARVTPEGTVQLPAIGSVPAQGLTLEELKREIDQRYAQIVDGIEVTPILEQRAPRFIYVVGEVTTSGRFEMTQPTTAMQAIALAGGWRNGGNLRQIVIFRRAEDWRLLATRLDLNGALLGKRPCPADEIWLRDSDIVVVPKNPLRRADDMIELVFSRGIYGVAPFLSNGFQSPGTLR